MISIWASWTDTVAIDDCPAQSLGLFAGNPASSFLDSGWAYAQLASPRAKPTRGWRPVQHPSGRRALFNGWFDNRDDIAGSLGLKRDIADADLYLAAIERWGDDADNHCIGSYCSIVTDQNARTIRLACSPYDAPPLYYHHSSDQSVAASVPRALFAAGVSSRLNRQRLVQNLLYYIGAENSEWYDDVIALPLGSIAVLSPTGIRRHRYYDPLNYIGSSRPQIDAAEHANALLEEAAGKVLVRMRKPGILLSGGLDSPLAAAAMMRRMPDQTPLHSFTFTPGKDWKGKAAVGRYGNDAPFVREFAAMHPKLRPQFFGNEGINFDHKSRELMAAMGIAPIGMPNIYMFHSLCEAARDAGCDGLITADLGNLTYSNGGFWALGEQFRNLQWRRLAANLFAKQLDWRSPPRRFAAYVAMPMLPLELANGLRTWLKGKQSSAHIDAGIALNPTLLSAPEAMGADGKPINRQFGSFDRDRQQQVKNSFGSGQDVEGDTRQAFEQIYGLQQRDISAYRPLVEFCLSLSGEEFLSDGNDRWLARRMGKGRIPEAQRLNRNYGSHGVDWHSRMAAQREDLLSEMKRCREDPELAALLDFDRLIPALENWPDEEPMDFVEAAPLQLGVTRTIWTSRFVHFVNGKN